MNFQTHKRYLDNSLTDSGSDAARERENVGLYVVNW